MAAAPLNRVELAVLVVMDSLLAHMELMLESRRNQQDSPETSVLVANQPETMPFPGKSQE